MAAYVVKRARLSRSAALPTIKRRGLVSLLPHYSQVTKCADANRSSSTSFAGRGKPEKLLACFFISYSFRRSFAYVIGAAGPTPAGTRIGFQPTPAGRPLPVGVTERRGTRKPAQFGNDDARKRESDDQQRLAESRQLGLCNSLPWVASLCFSLDDRVEMGDGPADEQSDE